MNKREKIYNYISHGLLNMHDVDRVRLKKKAKSPFTWPGLIFIHHVRISSRVYKGRTRMRDGYFTICAVDSLAQPRSDVTIRVSRLRDLGSSDFSGACLEQSSSRLKMSTGVGIVVIWKEWAAMRVQLPSLDRKHVNFPSSLGYLPVYF